MYILLEIGKLKVKKIVIKWRIEEKVNGGYILGVEIWGRVVIAVQELSFLSPNSPLSLSFVPSDNVFRFTYDYFISFSQLNITKQCPTLTTTRLWRCFSTVWTSNKEIAGREKNNSNRTSLLPVTRGAK